EAAQTPPPAGVTAYDPAANSMSMYANDPATGVKPDFEITIPVSDSKGGQRNITVSFLKSSVANEWHAEIRAPEGTVTNTDGLLKSGRIAFTQDGRLDVAKMQGWTAGTGLFDDPTNASLSLGSSDGATPGADGAWDPSLGIAAQTIASVAAKLPASHVIVAAGDFNFNCAPAERKGLATAFKGWVLPSQLDNACRGSGSQFYWREKTWSYLDVITQKATGASQAWAIEPKTFRAVLTDEEQLQWDERDQVMRPKAFRFNVETGRGSGTADHWPIAIDLVQANP
ncbi:MAG: hypothetical protein B7Z26_06680, partial [Asticcacaulis sp. 32-58-5]